MELEQLIATEQRLDEALRRTRAETARVIEEARAAASRAEAALAADIAAAAGVLARNAATERREREAAIVREAAEQVARVDTVSAPRIRAIAQDMVNLLVVKQAP